MIACRVVLLVALAGAAPAAALSPVRVYAAGSVSGALAAISARYTAETGQPVALHSGSAGLLLEQIEAGADADVFVSANMVHPQRLTAEGKASATVVFARNRICVTARPDVGLTSANLLTRMLDPARGLGTSTPGADPAGDYAWKFFEKADGVRPGAAAQLKAKAQQLVGGAHAAAIPAGQSPVAYYLGQHRVDMFVGYCSRHDTISDPGLDQVELPPELAVAADYGLTVLTTGGDPARREAGYRFALYLMSPAAQALLPAYRFTPVAAAR